MSSGDATVAGNRIEYILRMPRYEMVGVEDPARALFDHIRFTSGFETARRLDGECHDDPASNNYLCAANYEFAKPVDRLGVDCTFYEVTVPNHIHMLRAERNGRSAQAILDSGFPSATLAFRPPTALETAAQQSGAGAMRVWTAAVQLLLLAALAMAARSSRELGALAAAYLAGECAGTVAILRTGWEPSLRFAEAAAALALAYLALEILVFPKSGGRWLIAAALGAFEGLYFSTFVSESGYGAFWVLAGAVAAGALVLLFAGVGLYAFVNDRYRALLSRGAALALFLTGSVWFALRLRN